MFPGGNVVVCKRLPDLHKKENTKHLLEATTAVVIKVILVDVLCDL